MWWSASTSMQDVAANCGADCQCKVPLDAGVLLPTVGENLSNGCPEIWTTVITNAHLGMATCVGNDAP